MILGPVVKVSDVAHGTLVNFCAFHSGKSNILAFVVFYQQKQKIGSSSSFTLLLPVLKHTKCKYI